MARAPLFGAPRVKFCSLALACILGFGSSLRAQNPNLACPFHDHLFVYTYGSCCSPVTSIFPVFPAITIGGVGACIGNCDLQGQFSTATHIIPVQVSTDEFTIAIQIDAPGSGFQISSQPLFGKYVRTWVDIDPSGEQVQVW